jgi:hypothetical protein
MVRQYQQIDPKEKENSSTITSAVRPKYTRTLSAERAS